MKKSRIVIELTGRYLTDDEADQVRLMVATMKPKTHLVMSGWRWIEVRGLSEEKALRLIEELRRRGLRFTVTGFGPERRAKGEALKRKQTAFERLAARA